MQSRKENNVTFLSSQEAEIISDLQLLEGSTWFDYDHENPDVPLKTILKICAEVWQVNPKIFYSKTDHKDSLDKLRKKSFFWACKYFSNICPWECSRFINVRRPWYFGDLDWYIFNFPNKKFKHGSQLIKILSLLAELRPERLKDINNVSFDNIAGVTEPEHKQIYKIDKRLISSLATHDLAWFYNNNTQFTMIAFSLNGDDCKQILFSRTSDHKLLFKMQGHGYRFVTEDDALLLIAHNIRMQSEKQLEEAKRQSEKINAAFSRQSLVEKKAPERSRYELIGSSSQKVRSFYKKEPVAELQCELILWQESEHYEICQVLKTMIDEIILQPKKTQHGKK